MGDVLRRAWIALALAGSLATACQTYAETVGCGMGLVLDEHDGCVPPRRPDGGASIATCAALCDVVPSWTDAQRACLAERFAAFGALPASCEDLTSSASCLACTAEVGATDEACAGGAALCL